MGPMCVRVRRGMCFAGVRRADEVVYGRSFCSLGVL